MSLAVGLLTLYKSTGFLKDIVESLQTNSTLVEDCKSTHGRRLPFIDALCEVLGPPWTWVFPLRMPLEVDFAEPAFPNDPTQKCHSTHCTASAGETSEVFEDFLMEEDSSDVEPPGWRTVCLDQGELAFGGHNLTESIDSLTSDLKTRIRERVQGECD